MMKKIVLNIIFYVLIVFVAVGAGIFYERNYLKPPPLLPTGATTADQRCIITVFGHEYDVTSLRTTHTGGDIFECGADMSAAYLKKHGSNTRMIQQYLVK
jgi:hypothetical protein